MAGADDDAKNQVWLIDRGGVDADESHGIRRPSFRRHHWARYLDWSERTARRR